MKFGSAAVFLLLSIPLCAHAGAAKSGLSPVTRVVQLLQDLTKKIKAEAKAEEDLYESFVCWGKSIIDQKTASNAAAQSRIDSLEAYIADIKAGKIEFTTERVDLEQEIKGLEEDIANADAIRAKEHEDYLAATEEMKMGIAALEKAIEVLKTGTAEKASLLSLRSRMGESSKQREADGAALSKAIEFGKKFLSKGDALFLERVLNAEVPEVDWKKLNRKATFKMKYKARSGKIQEVLADLLQTFKTNLEEAEAKEKAALESYEKLMTSKKDQLDKAQQALKDMFAEGGARQMSEAEAQEEVDSLKAQIEADKAFIAQTEKALAEKKQEWKDRKALRAGELAAIAKAIEILHNDDARDLFKKSFASQGYLLLQEAAGVAVAARGRHVLEMLRGLGQKTGDRRLLSLASSKGSSHFDEVIEAIDKMLATLKAEQEEDLIQKEACEKERAEKTRESVVSSRSIDEMSDAIAKLMAEIKELLAEKKEAEASIEELKKALAEATAQREKEHAEWVTSDQEDGQAAEIVAQAKEVLDAFYADNNLVLVQGKAVPVEAGQAPPPPPTTWEAPYGGKTQEAQGISSILEMIKEDILKDQAKAKAAEEAAEAEYQSFKKLTEEQLKELAAKIVELVAAMSDKKQEIEDTKKERLAEKKNLDAIMQTLKDLTPGCDFVAVNFQVRNSNRQIEIDGLLKAKAILQGAAFEN